MLKQLLLALKRLLRALGPVLVGCIFLGAVYLLYREISKYSLADIRMSLAQISTGSIILSVLLYTALSRVPEIHKAFWKGE